MKYVAAFVETLFLEIMSMKQQISFQKLVSKSGR